MVLSDPRGVAVFPSHLRLTNAYHTDAGEINAARKNKTYNFLRVDSWFEVGAQAPCATGWRPDCVCYVFVPVDIKKAVRPRCGPGKHIVVGGFDTIDWITTPGRGFSIDIPGPDAAGSLDVRVKTYYVKGGGPTLPVPGGA